MGDMILTLILITLYYIAEINYTDGDVKYKKEKHKFKFKKIQEDKKEQKEC